VTKQSRITTQLSLRGECVSTRRSNLITDQHRAPLWEVLLRHAKNNVTSFHTPGHKNGRGISPPFKRFVGEGIFKFDVTVFPEVDSLHAPSGPIRDAQKLASQAWGSRESFFLVNGSSVGNFAMFLAALKPGESVIVSRNTHKSVLSGLILSGVWPIWIQPAVDRKLNIILNSSSEQIEEEIKNFPEAKAVFLTNPTYNGVCTDVAKIVSLCRKKRKLLLIDEAHGPHLGFHPAFPDSSVHAGADLVVQSAHKILSAMSQGSILHLNSHRVDLSRLKQVVSMLQTTSPSYPILASIDLARRQLVQQGRELLQTMMECSEWARQRIRRLEKIKCFSEDDLPPGYRIDYSKLTIDVSGTGLTGYEVEDLLASKYRIQVDCADTFNLIAILGVGTRMEDMRRLVNALEEIDLEKLQRCSSLPKLEMPSLSTEMVMTPRDVFLAGQVRKVPISKASGSISAEALTIYPPGIPILIPGERVSQEIVEYLLDLAERDITVTGQDGRRLNMLKVVA